MKPTRQRSAVKLNLLELEVRAVPTQFTWVSSNQAGVNPNKGSEGKDWLNMTANMTNVGFPGDGTDPNGDEAIFAGVNNMTGAQANANCTFDGGARSTLKILTIQSGYSGTITLTHNLTITSSMSMQGGTVDTGSSTLSIGDVFLDPGPPQYAATFNWKFGTIKGATDGGL